MKRKMCLRVSGASVSEHAEAREAERSRLYPAFQGGVNDFKPVKNISSLYRRDNSSVY